MTLMNLYSFPRCFGSFQAILMLLLERSGIIPLEQGSTLLIILSARCMCLALLWISGCHVCLLTGFQPYGMARIWTKLNATGCQEQGRVRQQEEHVKRPDGFLCGDGDLVGQSVLVGEVSKCETRLFSIMAAVAAWKLERQACEWKVSSLKCLLRKVTKFSSLKKPKLYCRCTLEQRIKGVANRSLVRLWKHDMNMKHGVDRKKKSLCLGNNMV